MAPLYINLAGRGGRSLTPMTGTRLNLEAQRRSTGARPQRGRHSSAAATQQRGRNAGAHRRAAAQVSRRATEVDRLGLTGGMLNTQDIYAQGHDTRTDIYC